MTTKRKKTASHTSASRRASAARAGQVRASGVPHVLNLEHSQRLLRAMEQELARHTRGLRQPGEPPPFFLSYLLHAKEGLSVWGRYGSVFRSEPQRDADLYAEIRVGSHRLDNTIDGGLTGDLTQRQSFNWIEGPEDFDPDVLRYALWRLSQHKYDESLQEYYEKKKILVEQQLPSRGKSFSVEPVTTHFDDVKPVVFPKKRWEAFVRDTSALYRDYRFMLDPYVQIRGLNKVRIFVNSEGSRFICQDTYYEVSLQAFLLGPDGVHLESTRTFYGRDQSDLPSRAKVAAAIDEMARELKDLAAAKPLDPYAGPALLSGFASGLIFHEAIGHRLEGERMGSRSEGYTFASKIGQRILPPGVDIVDDPTLRSIDGVPLHGAYLIDDEAVPAQRTELVEDGVLKSFLGSRQLVEGGGKRSNGHGRHERFQDPMARMANLIVTARDTKTWDELKAQLCEETLRRGLPYGLIIRGVSAGETRTDQYDFQAFKGIPTAVYTVDPKTGKETRVRDVSFIGTPLAVMQRILGFGRDSEVDNSYCYAESGAVPVATVAPAMLVGELELQRASTRRYRPARLPLPPMR
ncbi:MAG TPA: TldD/PmbA family protein [Polyangiales bacterium]